MEAQQFTSQSTAQGDLAVLPTGQEQPVTGAAAVLTNNVEIFKNGSLTLQKNKGRAAKAIKLGETLEALITINGGMLDAELDVQAHKFIQSCNAAKSEMEQERKPVTQMMDLVKGEFTAAERELDHKAPGTIANRIQGHRNAYVQELHRQEQVRLDIAQKAKDKEVEAASLKHQADTSLLQHVFNYALEKKRQLNDIFAAITLENQGEQLGAMAAFSTLYPYDHFNGWLAPEVAKWGYIRPMHHDQAELDLLARNVWMGRFDKISLDMAVELTEVKQQLLAMVPTRLAELQLIKEAEPELQQTMLADLAERTEGQGDRLEQEHMEGVAQMLQAVDQEKVVATTEALFTGTYGAATAAAPEAPKSNKTFELEVLHPAGWPLVFQFWFENQGKDMPLEKAGKKTLAAMAKFAGDTFTAGGAKIVNTPHLRYNEVVKAATSRSTAKKDQE